MCRDRKQLLWKTIVKHHELDQIVKIKMINMDSKVCFKSSLTGALAFITELSVK